MTNVRHRFIILIVGVVCISSVLLYYCSNENAYPSSVPDINDKIVLSVNEESVSAEGITLNIQNELGKTIFLNPQYRLEKFSEKGWVEVDSVQGENWAEDDWQMAIYAGSRDSKEYLWKWSYGKLTTGKYRIIVLVLTEENDTLVEHNLAATFSIP